MTGSRKTPETKSANVGELIPKTVTRARDLKKRTRINFFSKFNFHRKP